MDDIAKLKNEIWIASLVIALIAELVSLPIIGWDVGFLCGLALGTLSSIVSFGVLVWAGKRAIEQGKKSMSVVGYFIRLAIYGLAFVIAIKLSLYAALASLIGIMSSKLALIYAYGIKPKVGRKPNKKDAPTKEIRLKGRVYKTHKHIR